LFIRRYRLPSDVVEGLIGGLALQLYRARDRGELPVSLSEDIYNLVRSEVGAAAGLEMLVKPKRKKEEKRRISEAKIENVSKIAVDLDQPALFFLGAGASKPPPSNIPVVSELLDELWKRSNKMENKPLAKLEAWCTENKINNIEEMLTGVTLSDFMRRNRKVHNLLNSVLYPEWSSLKELSIRDVESVSSFQNMIDTFFSLLVGTMLNAQPNPIHGAIADFIKSFGNTNIVTTNYDVCMDQALDNAKIEHSYVIGSHNGKGSVPLVKMHGSINWFYCQTCQNVLMPTVENMRNAVKNDVPYAVTGMCPVCTAPTKQFIVPPTTYKFLIYPPIVEVWNAGRQIFESSKIYVIIGYSFSLGDDYISKMLLKAIREDPTKQLIIIDKSNETIERFKSYVRTHTVSFKEENFHDFTGPAEEIAPKVIKALKEGKPRKRGRKQVAGTQTK
jgi:NAD-dependent SIR2 family protein deacetylase